MPQPLLQQSFLQGSACQQPTLRLQQVHRGCRRKAVACYARRTVSGDRDTDAGPKKASLLKRPDNGTSNNGTSKTKSSKSAPVVVKPPAAPQHSNSRGTQSTQRQMNKPSRLENFMRNTPGFNRFLDGTLILGDAVMVLATELSSERLPLEQLPALGGVAVASWVIAGAILGDYMAEPDPDANPLSDAMGWPIFAAVVNAMITWALGMVVSIFGFSWLVSNFIVEPEMVLEVARDGMLSPQLEISVALLITMSCWRGMAARLRL